LFSVGCLRDRCHFVLNLCVFTFLFLEQIKYCFENSNKIFLVVAISASQLLEGQQTIFYFRPKQSLCSNSNNNIDKITTVTKSIQYYQSFIHVIINVTNNINVTKQQKAKQFFFVSDPFADGDCARHQKYSAKFTMWPSPSGPQLWLQRLFYCMSTTTLTPRQLRSTDVKGLLFCFPNRSKGLQMKQPKR